VDATPWLILVGIALPAGLIVGVIAVIEVWYNVNVRPSAFGLAIIAVAMIVGIVIGLMLVPVIDLFSIPSLLIWMAPGLVALALGVAALAARETGAARPLVTLVLAVMLFQLGVIIGTAL
jgi:hypothetical protein